MLIIPAIDIKDGKCVRLFKGDFQQSKIYFQDPAQVARMFKDTGAELIHVIDLDGARTGRINNLETVERIIRSADIPIELGGGIRTKDSVEKLYNTGVRRIILGTRVIEDIRFLDEIKEYIKNIIVSIDLKNEYLSTHGWVDKTDMHYKDYIKGLLEYNIKEVIVTDIDRDGTLEGPNFGLYEKIAEEFPQMNIITSGGISKFDDVKKIIDIKKDNIKGIIIGKAIYEKTIDLKEALEYAG